MDNLWFLVRPPRGSSVRRALALLSFLLSFFYLFQEGKDSFSPYAYQEQLMPLWAYGVLLIVGSILLIATIDMRNSLIGRIVALVGFVVYVLFSLSFYPVDPTESIMYAVFAYMALGETGHVRPDND